LKERICGRVVGELHPDMTPFVLVHQHNPKTTYRPPVANWFADQFSPAVKSINPIHGVMLSHLANYGLDGAPRLVLEGRVAFAVHNFYMTPHSHSLRSTTGRAGTIGCGEEI